MPTETRFPPAGADRLKITRGPRPADSQRATDQGDRFFTLAGQANSSRKTPARPSSRQQSGGPGAAADRRCRTDDADRRWRGSPRPISHSAGPVKDGEFDHEPSRRRPLGRRPKEDRNHDYREQLQRQRGRQGRPSRSTPPGDPSWLPWSSTTSPSPFQVDHYDSTGGFGRSVLAQGTAAMVQEVMASQLAAEENVAPTRLVRMPSRRSARRSSAVSPPQIPYSCPVRTAKSRQLSITGQRAQMALADAISCNDGPVLPTGKKSSGSPPRQAAQSRQPQSSCRSIQLTAFLARRVASVSVAAWPERLAGRHQPANSHRQGPFVEGARRLPQTSRVGHPHW